MKKLSLIISALVLINLNGCKEKETGLEKKVLNAAIDDCKKRLLNNLKSPSSMRLNSIFLSNDYADAKDIYRIYSKTILGDSGKVSKLIKRANERYRTLNIYLDYEAQNSFGVYLRNEVSCSYIYKLRYEDTSPENEIVLSKLNDSFEFEGYKVNLDNYSNQRITPKDVQITNNTSSEYTEKDKELLEKIEYIWDTEQVFKQFSTGKMVDYAS